MLEAGERVDVTAVSKGKGFAGAMKRHGFKGRGASHGAHRVHRAPGSIGACATPARVFKGTKMAGRMGGEKVTTLNLEVVAGRRRARPAARARARSPAPTAGSCSIRDAVKAGKGDVMADRRRQGPPPATKPAPSSSTTRSSASSPTCRSCTRSSTAQLAARAVRHADHQDPRRGPRRRRQAVAPEGHRPRPPGSIRAPQWRGGGVALGPEAPQLRPEDAQEDDAPRAALGAVRSRRRRQGRRRRRLGLRRAEDQGRRRPRSTALGLEGEGAASCSATTRSQAACAELPQPRRTCHVRARRRAERLRRARAATGSCSPRRRCRTTPCRRHAVEARPAAQAPTTEEVKA